MSCRRVAVIGAGLSGLSCVTSLVTKSSANIHVTVFDKARRCGGRLATRQSRQHPLVFDHGAQYYTVRSKEFRETWHDSWLKRGVVKRWSPRLVAIEHSTGNIDEVNQEETERFVGVGGNTVLCADIYTQLEEEKSIKWHFNSRVTHVERKGATYQLQVDGDQKHFDGFDVVVAAMPPQQAAELLNTVDPELAETISGVRMGGTWAAMVAFDKRIDVAFDAAFINAKRGHERSQTGSLDASSADVEAPPLSWIARDSHKPGRHAESDCWVVHSTDKFFSSCSETSPEETQTILLREFKDVLKRATGVDVPNPSLLQAHRWRYSFPHKVLPAEYVFNQSGLAACGDWCGGARVEGAFLSGHRLGNHLKRSLAKSHPASL